MTAADKEKDRSNLYRGEAGGAVGRGGRTTAYQNEAFERRQRIAAWVAETIMPHERAVRGWLARARLSREDSDDIIQEAYCRLAALDAVDQILRPDAYFFSIVRNEMTARLRRSRVVAIEAAAELDALADDARPSPEQEAGGRRDYARLRSIMATLPDRCRRIVEMRKFEGWSQKEIADQLGVTESIVENDVHAGVRAILRAWREGDAVVAQRLVRYASSGKSAR